MSLRSHSQVSKHHQALLKELRKVEVLFQKVQRSFWWRTQRVGKWFQAYQQNVALFEASSGDPSLAMRVASTTAHHAGWLIGELELAGWRKPKVSLLKELHAKLEKLKEGEEKYASSVVQWLQDHAIAELQGTAESVVDESHARAQYFPSPTQVTYEPYRGLNDALKFSLHPLFDSAWYQVTYMQEQSVEPLDHFMRQGWMQGHKPYPSFDELAFFKEVRPLMAKRGINPLLLYKNDPAFRAKYADERVTYADWLKASSLLNPAPPSPSSAPRFKVCWVENDPLQGTASLLANQDSRLWERLDAEDEGSLPPSEGQVLTDEFLLYVLPSVQLAPEALQVFAHTVANHPEAQVIYADEDHWVDGQRVQPFFKTDFLQESLRSQAYLGGLLVVRREVLKRLPSFRHPKNELELWEMCLHLSHHCTAQEIVHVPRILSHRATAALSLSSGNSEVQAMIERYLHAYGIAAKVASTDDGLSYLAYELPSPAPKVSVIVPTRNKLDYVERCVSSILRRSTYENFEILIVDNGSNDLKCLAYLGEVSSREPKVRVLHYSHPFNYSAINNFAVNHATGEVLILLNNDTEVIRPDWIEQMVSLAMRPEVGCVGALLYFPNNTIQHAGVIMGLGGVANHALLHQPRGTSGYHGSLTLVTEVDAVTAACLAVRKSVYEQVGGLDEENLTVAFNDVDFCLKVHEAGYRNLFTPFAELYHFESVSRGLEDTPEKFARFKGEVEHMQRKWDHRIHSTRCYNPNLSETATKTYRWAWPPRKLPEL